MSKFDELHKKVKDVDPDQDQSKVKDLIRQIKDARENDEIGEDEKTSLIREAQNKLGDNIDLGGLDL